MKAETLKDVRAKLGLTPEQMSDLLQIGKRTYYRYEANQGNIPRSIEAHIITLLNCPTYLMGIVGKLKGTVP